MERLNYRDELAKHYPQLAQKRKLRLVINQKFHPKTTLHATPTASSSFINLDFYQGEKFVGFRMVGLLELEPLWRTHNETI